jgi:hypothetical protein
MRVYPFLLLFIFSFSFYLFIYFIIIFFNIIFFEIKKNVCVRYYPQSNTPQTLKRRCEVVKQSTSRKGAGNMQAIRRKAADMSKTRAAVSRKLVEQYVENSRSCTPKTRGAVRRKLAEQYANSTLQSRYQP